MGYWPVVLNVLRNSDVVLLLVDARMPQISRNSEIISKVENMKGKRLVLIFNKCDLVSKDILKEMKELYKDAYFVSGKKKSSLKDLKKYLVNLSENFSRSSLRVGIVGYPNVGKSTVLNILVPKARAKVSRVSGTTKKIQWVREGRLRFMDSPGVIPFSDKKIEVGMTASKDPHKIKNPEKVALTVVEYLSGQGFLEKFYGVEKGPEGYDLFLAIGKKKGFLVKGGEVDEHRTAIKILEDWQRGKISLK